MTQLLDNVDLLIDMQVHLDRRIGRLAKRRRKDPNRLAPLLEIVPWVPQDLHDLYLRYDGAVGTITLWEELAYFFGHFSWKSVSFMTSNNPGLRTNRNLPLLDEVAFAHGRSALRLVIVPLGEESYIMAATLPTSKGIRYPAFDSLNGMVASYIDALRDKVWTFGDDGTSHFDLPAFARIVDRHNAHGDYWRLLAEDKVDFQYDAEEERRAKPLPPVTGRELLRRSGFDL